MTSTPASSHISAPPSNTTNINDDDGGNNSNNITSNSDSSVHIKAEEPDMDGDLNMNLPQGAGDEGTANTSNEAASQPGANGAPEGMANDDPSAIGIGPGADGMLPPPVQRKDKNLKEFLNSMDEYAPIIPDAVTDYYLALSGLSTPDIRLKRLLALATQKFISDIATDAYQYSRIRSTTGGNAGGGGGFPGGGAIGGIPGGGGGAAAAPGGGGGGGGGGGALRPMPRPGFGAGGSGGSSARSVLTMEDLGAAVAEYGVNTKRPEFYR
ncbi:putative transcription initiation factor TFIID subunit [Peziza echinospora]|nr:putative transcription initiation factor TFIID subunit [Peziza echinospora]